MIITVGGIKGGSGKSTLATHLAVIYSTRGHKVLLVDTDEQCTSYDFTQLRIGRLGDAGYTCTKQSGAQVHHALRGFATAFDVLIVDTGGRDSKAQRAALLVSDLVVLPFVPRPYDAWTLDAVADLLEIVRGSNESLRALAFLNRADRGGPLVRGTEELLRSAITHGIESTDLRLHTRVAFGAASAHGLAVTEIHPPDPKACAEVLLLAEFIYAAALGQPNTLPVTTIKEKNNADSSEKDGHHDEKAHSAGNYQ